MSSQKIIERYGPNYELPPLEDQVYLFKNKYYKQELLPYEENKERRVSNYYSINYYSINYYSINNILI